jgi:shikimate dehydrogenase
MIKYGLIGYPIKQSTSPAYFSDKFKQLNLLDHCYELFPLAHIEQLHVLLKSETHLKGLNVTIPHKVAVMPYLDEIDSIAEQIGAVNTIKITRLGSTIQLSGFNSDYYGFRDSLLPLLQAHDKNALVLGNGGAAKAVAYVLQELGIEYTVVSRNKQARLLNYEDLDPAIIKSHSIIINCTPLGKHPDIEYKPNIPYEAITPSHLLYDLTYLPQLTSFLAEGKKRNARTKNGLEMLHRQADISWEFWNT